MARVLHVLADLGRSGAESMLLAARSDFARRGYECDVLATGSTPGPMADAFAASGFTVHHLPFEKTPRFFLRAYRVLRRGRYDVIHLHTERANFWFGVAALVARPRRVLRTIHSVFTFEGRLRRRRGAQRRLLRRAGVVHVACGPAVQRNELQRFGLETALVPSWYDSRTFVPPAVGVREEARTSLGIGDEELVLVTTATCSPVKNHVALLQAMARLPETRRPLYLHVGIEEPDHPERKAADALGIAERVRFLGPVPDLLPVYAAADVYVMPSLYEGFSVAVLEALGAGLPVLLADVGGLGDLRAHYDGLMYSAPTAEGFAAALEELIVRSHDELRRVSAGYAEITRRHFGIESGVARYVAIYDGDSPRR